MIALLIETKDGMEAKKAEDAFHYSLFKKRDREESNLRLRSWKPALYH